MGTLVTRSLPPSAGRRGLWRSVVGEPGCRGREPRTAPGRVRTAGSLWRREAEAEGRAGSQPPARRGFKAERPKERRRPGAQQRGREEMVVSQKGLNKLASSPAPRSCVGAAWGPSGMGPPGLGAAGPALAVDPATSPVRGCGMRGWIWCRVVSGRSTLAQGWPCHLEPYLGVLVPQFPPLCSGNLEWATFEAPLADHPRGLAARVLVAAPRTGARTQTGI